MKWISWNVNGLRACLNKGFSEFLLSEQPDILALQEIKMKPEQADFSFDGYHIIWNSAEKNGYSGMKRLNTRMEWEDRFRVYLGELAKDRPVIVCGDMNVAPQEIDLKNPATNHQNAGFSDEERAKFTELLNSGWIDTFRYLYPDRRDAYSWWSYRFRSRERNAGWRIDYFLMRKEDAPFLKEHTIYSNVYGSDHCPVGIVTEGL